MSRYGWAGRGQISPLTSSIGAEGGVPSVTDEDYSYITSADLESQGLDAPRQVVSGNDSGEKLDDDILLIRNKGVTYSERFPAFSIGDGKLLVVDVQDRAKVLMHLPDRRAAKFDLYYKGHQLKDAAASIRDYGVKNKSEILVVLTDASAECSEDGSEELVVAGQDEEKAAKKSRKKRKSKKKRSRSPGHAASHVGLKVFQAGGESEVSRSRGHSPASWGLSSSATPGGSIDKLDNLATHFTTKLLPLCVQFTAGPPLDPKKRLDEHRKLSETVMQQVILKLDEVDIAGDEEARARRKEVIRQVQAVLRTLDEKLE